MRRTVSWMMAISPALLLALAAPTAAADKDDLTGKWSCDDGGVYYIRQVGNEVWWSGHSGEGKDKKKAFANVFHGTINGDKIGGAWVDDPAGEARGSGHLTLEIVRDGKKIHLKKTKEDGSGFGGGMWTPHK